MSVEDKATLSERVAHLQSQWRVAHHVLKSDPSPALAERVYRSLQTAVRWLSQAPIDPSDPRAAAIDSLVIAIGQTEMDLDGDPRLYSSDWPIAYLEHLTPLALRAIDSIEHRGRLMERRIQSQPKRRNKSWLPVAAALLKSDPTMTDGDLANKLRKSPSTLSRSKEWARKRAEIANEERERIAMDYAFDSELSIRTR